MPDACFADPRLAAVYDAVEGERADLDHHLALADELGAGRVLDVGCGTGTFALRLAATGRDVVGLDPADASLDVARAKPGADAVTWLHGAATDAPVGTEADLAVMTGNVAQDFLGDDELADALVAVAGAVRPGGHVVLETRRPERRAWEDWARWTQACHDVPGTGVVRQDRRVTAVRPPLVSFHVATTFERDGTVVESTSTLRFWTLDEVDAALAVAGLERTDVREAPDRPGHEHVVVARRPTLRPTR